MPEGKIEQGKDVEEIQEISGIKPTTRPPGRNLTGPIVLAVACAIVFGGLGYYLGKKSANTTPVATIQTATATAITTASGSAVSTANWKTYTNSDYGYSFKHPSNYYVKDTCDNDEKNNKDFVLISKKKLGNDVIDCTNQKGLLEMSVLTIGVTSDISTDWSNGSSSTSSEVIGGQTWTKYIFQYDPNSSLDSNNNSTLLALTRSEKTYLINWINSDSNGSHDSSIDGILSTFQFTPVK